MKLTAKKRAFCLFAFFSLLPFLLILARLPLRTQAEGPAYEPARLAPIEDEAVLGEIVRDYTQPHYVYFGSSSSPECAAFERVLTEVLAEDGRTVLFYDTDAWRKDASFAETLAQFGVASVPALVRVRGEAMSPQEDFILEPFLYDPALPAEAQPRLLSAFLQEGPPSVFSVQTAAAQPVRFTRRFVLFIWGLLFLNGAWLAWNKQRLAEDHTPLGLPALGSTLAFFLWIFLLLSERAYRSVYAAALAGDTLSLLGEPASLSIPLTYCLILVLFVRIRAGQRVDWAKADKEG